MPTLLFAKLVYDGHHHGDDHDGHQKVYPLEREGAVLGGVDQSAEHLRAGEARRGRSREPSKSSAAQFHALPPGRARGC